MPAVLTVEGDTFWGYTSVPANRVRWWKALPDALPGGGKLYRQELRPRYGCAGPVVFSSRQPDSVGRRVVIRPGQDEYRYVRYLV